MENFGWNDEYLQTGKRGQVSLSGAQPRNH